MVWYASMQVPPTFETLHMPQLQVFQNETIIIYDPIRRNVVSFDMQSTSGDVCLSCSLCLKSRTGWNSAAYEVGNTQNPILASPRRLEYTKG